MTHLGHESRAIHAAYAGGAQVAVLPLEFYEIIHHVTLAKIALTVGNLIILGYLIHVIRRKQEHPPDQQTTR